MSPTADRVSRYAWPAISLHWLIAVLIFGGFGLGLYMHELPLSPQKLQLYSYHKWIGVTVFLLALLRAGWRVTHTPPPAPVGTAPWQRTAATATHALLYALMFLIPLSGWVHSSAAGFQVVYFGLIPLPDLVPKDKALAEQFGELHEILAFTLAALVGLHLAATLKHYFFDRDEVLTRMLPVIKRPTGARRSKP